MRGCACHKDNCDTVYSNAGSRVGTHVSIAALSHLPPCPSVSGVHGITDADVRGAPSPRDALLRFWAFVEEHVPEGTDLVLAAHNARRYDNVVMAHEVRQHTLARHTR